MKISDLEREIADKMAGSVRRFCEWCEMTPAQYSTVDLEHIEILLVDMLAQSLRLPDIEFVEANRAKRIDDEAWGRMYAKLQSLPLDLYWDVFDPLDAGDHEPCCGSLADDLADIYRDFSEGLSLYELNNLPAAIWTWRFQFQTHSGMHIAGALRAIRAFRAHHDDNCWTSVWAGLDRKLGS